MTTKRIAEAGTITVAEDGSFPVCLITEGAGSSADFPRGFFTQANADALANSLSFPSHPVELDKPQHRDPLSAIGKIGESVTIQETDGKMGFWSRFLPAKSKPQVAEYLAEFGHLLGLSVYADSDGHNDPATGRWVAESLNGSDPYKSVDLVVAAGRGGKFVKVGESLGLITQTSTPVEEKRALTMEKDVEDRFNDLEAKIMGKLAEALAAAPAPLQDKEPDKAAVDAAVNTRLTEYQAKVKVIAEAKTLSESQVAELNALALDGKDITDALAKAVKVSEEFGKRALTEDVNGEKQEHYTVAEHLSGGDTTSKFSASSLVPGFGKVA